MVERVAKRIGAEVADAVDRAFYQLALARGSRSRNRSRSESLGPIERAWALRQLIDIYDDVPDDAFFLEPRAPEPQLAHVRALEAGEVVDATWSSHYRPYAAEISERYLAHPKNDTVSARLFLHADRPRPTAVLVHGYLGGHFAVEERIWPVDWLFDRGLDVALAVLPFHGPRAGSRKIRPVFPNSDPRVTIDGFRQAMFDLRGLARFLRERGSPAVGAIGMSLGGYSAALLATVDPELAFVVPVIPLASIADFARDGGRLVGTASQQREQHELLETLHRVVSPLSRAPRVPPDARLVVAAERDRIAPLAHAERIAEHFGAPLEVFAGGHLLQIGRSHGFRAIGRLLGRLGLLEPR